MGDNYLFAEILLSTIEGCVVEIGDNCFEEEWTQLAADDVDMKMIVVKIAGLQRIMGEIHHISVIY